MGSCAAYVCKKSIRPPVAHVANALALMCSVSLTAIPVRLRPTSSATIRPMLLREWALRLLEELHTPLNLSVHHSILIEGLYPFTESRDHRPELGRGLCGLAEL